MREDGAAEPARPGWGEQWESSVARVPVGCEARLCLTGCR